MDREAEEMLQAPMRKLRAALAGEGSPEWRRQQLMAEFVRAHRRPGNWFPGVLAAAAAVLLMLAAGLVWRGAPGRAGAEMAAVGYSDELEELMGEDGFTPVPYTRPLSGGEWLQVVRTELSGADMARMGMDVPLDDGNDFDAEVLLGEDGVPRAVRVVGDEQL